MKNLVLVFLILGDIVQPFNASLQIQEEFFCRNFLNHPVPPLSTPGENQVKNLTILDFNVSVVTAICRQLDGLPLAIELIASRVRMMPPQALLPSLTNDFTLQVDGMRNVPDRQLTLNNVIAWSYILLSLAEQTLLRRLAVFSGGWALGAAEMVYAGEGLEAHKVERRTQYCFIHKGH